MKGEVVLKILEIIEGLAIGTADILYVISNSGYGASYGKLNYELLKHRKERERKSAEKDLERREKQKYYNLILYLKKSGLIEEKHRDSKKFFILTKNGKDKLLKLREKNNTKLPENSYLKEENNKFIIVIFDIPEVERRKRVWLRAVLINLGFKMIQKSVWLGKIKIPKEFLEDLFKMKLVDFVEIFEISETGSLEHLI